MPIRSSLAVLAAAALLATGCGNEEEPPPSSSAQEDVPTQAPAADAPADAPADAAPESEQAKQEAFDAIVRAFDADSAAKDRCEAMTDSFREAFISDITDPRDRDGATSVGSCVKAIEFLEAGNESGMASGLLENYPPLDTTVDEYKAFFTPPSEFDPEYDPWPKDSEAVWSFESEVEGCGNYRAVLLDGEWYADNAENPAPGAC